MAPRSIQTAFPTGKFSVLAAKKAAKKATAKAKPAAAKKAAATGEPMEAPLG